MRELLVATGLLRDLLCTWLEARKLPDGQPLQASYPVIRCFLYATMADPYPYGKA